MKAPRNLTVRMVKPIKCDKLALSGMIGLCEPLDAHAVGFLYQVYRHYYYNESQERSFSPPSTPSINLPCYTVHLDWFGGVVLLDTSMT